MKLTGILFLLLFANYLFAYDNICQDDIIVSSYSIDNQYVVTALTGTGTSNPCADGFPSGSGTGLPTDFPLDNVPLTGSGCTDPNAHNFCPYALEENGDCIDCADGVMNGDEIGIDCGGILCQPCDDNDFDCDGVFDRFDLCPGISDTFDINRDSLPDCFQFIESMAYDSSWFCSPDSIYICDNGISTCIGTDSLIGYLRDGGYVGPCTPCIDSFSIAGTLRTRYGDLISQGKVLIESNDSLYPKEFTTGLNGFYAFRNNPIADNFRLTASKDDNYLNGVSTRDIVELYLIIIGNLRLSSPYWYIAADVNRDTELTIADLHDIRNLILGKTDSYPNNKSWLFLDANQVFADPYSPWPFVEEIMIIDFMGDQTSHDFIGVKIGDMNGDANPNSRKRSQVRYQNQSSMYLTNDPISAGDSHRYDFSINETQDLYGFQLQLDISELQFERIESTQIDIDDSNYQVDGNILSISWTGYIDQIDIDDVLFTIIGDSDQSEKSSQVMTLTETLQPELYTMNDRKIETSAVDLVIIDKETAGELIVYQNEPNPFSTSSMITYEVVTGGSVELRIMDVSGQTIYTQAVSAHAGSNQFMIDQDVIAQPGMYYYNIRQGDQAITKKLLKIE